VARFILSHAVVSECPLSAFLISFFKKSRFRFEATIADQDICRTRRIPDTIRPSLALGQRTQTAVKATVLLADWRMAIFPQADAQDCT
jgi:hypothetical protein